jgi:hypothetical protein
MGSHRATRDSTSRYHAARTVEQTPPVSARQVDLDALAAELLAVVEPSVQPARLSLWLRPPRQPPARYRKQLQLPLRRHDNFRVSVVTDQRHCPISTASKLSHLLNSRLQVRVLPEAPNIHRRRSDG